MRRSGEATEVRGDGGDEGLVPRTVVWPSPRLEVDVAAAVNRPSCRIAKRWGGLERGDLDGVLDADAEDLDPADAAGPDADRVRGRQDPDRLQVVHPAPAVARCRRGSPRRARSARRLTTKSGSAGGPRGPAGASRRSTSHAAIAPRTAGERAGQRASRIHSAIRSADAELDGHPGERASPRAPARHRLARGRRRRSRPAGASSRSPAARRRVPSPARSSRSRARTTTTRSDVPDAEERVELGRDGRAGGRVAHREARSSRPRRCCPCGPTARRPRGPGWKAAPHVPPTQWTGQMSPSCAKCGVCAGCQSWVYTTNAAAGLPAPPRLAVDDGDDGRAARHAQASAGVGEIVLHVDHDERRGRIVCLHGPRLAQTRAGSANGGACRPRTPAWAAADAPSPRTRLRSVALRGLTALPVSAPMYCRRIQAPAPRHRPGRDQEWIDSLDQVVDDEGEIRARFLMFKLLKRARQRHVGLPSLTQTRYINTISPEQEPFFPGDEELERRIRRLIRWNAVAMVLRANTRYPGIGGHLATYASAASLYEVGFNHFFRGKDATGGGDQVFFQGHAAPGMYARAFLEGRLSEDQLDHFRRETPPPGGLCSYPHPRLMPEFWEFPTVSMGLGPVSAIYQARFNRYLQNRGHADTSKSRVWAFLGDGEMDEPEALGALPSRPARVSTTSPSSSTATSSASTARSAATARSSRSSRRLPRRRLERHQGHLGPGVGRAPRPRRRRRPRREDEHDASTASSRSSRSPAGPISGSTSSGPIRACGAWWSTSPTTISRKLRRGGHDYRKVYAAYKAATEFRGAPTVILAKTVKGWTLGPGRRGPQHHPPGEEAVGERAARSSAIASSCRSPTARSRTRRTTTRARSPRRSSTSTSGAGRWAVRCRSGSCVARHCPAPKPSFDAEFDAGSPTPVSTTMAFTRLLRNLVRDPDLGPRIVPIIPDEARTFGMDPLFNEVGIYASGGQRYEPVDSELVMKYREAKDGQVLEEGITEAGSMASFTAAGDVLRDARPPDDPVLHLLLDVRLPADRGPDLGRRRLAGPRLPPRRDRRPHHARRRGPPARRRPQPHPGLHDPEHPGLRPGICLRAGRGRPRRDRADVRPGRGRLLLRDALQRELRAGAEAGRRRRGDPPGHLPVRRRRRSSPKAAPASGSSGPGRSSSRSIAAQALLAEKFGVAAEVYSAPSLSLLRRDGLRVDRWNRLHPAESRASRTSPGCSGRPAAR